MANLQITVIKSISYFLIIFFQISFENYSFSFIRSKSSSGADLYWKSDAITIVAYSKVLQNIPIKTVNEIIKNSVNEWNNLSSLKINLIFSTESQSVGKFKNGISEIYFLSNTSFPNLSNSYTEINYDDLTGVILESDIMLSDSIAYSSTIQEASSSKPFLGDLITHELGHLLGFAHNQSNGSSLFYQYLKGQSTLSSDDKIGLVNIRSASTLKGTISGKVIGGKGLIGLFAVNIQIYSHHKGTLVASLLSDENGYFTITGLELDDIYFIYLSPLKNLGSLPLFYQSSLSNFCLNSNFRGSFFSKCSSNDFGFPQGIELNSTEPTVNVGNVSIKCNLEFFDDYLVQKDYNKFQSTRLVTIDVEQPNGSFGNSYIGMFTESELDQNISDSFKFDFSNFKIGNDTNSLSDIYVDIKVVSQEFYSLLRPQITLMKSGVILEKVPKSVSQISLDSDLRPSIDLHLRGVLSEDRSKNIFELMVTPYRASSILNKEQLNNAFYGYEIFSDPIAFYFVIVSLVKKVGDNYIIYSKKNYKYYEDNTACIDGPLSTSMKGLRYNATSIQKSSSSIGVKNQNPLYKIVGCGLITSINEDKDNDDGENSSGKTGGSYKHFIRIISLLLGFLTSIVLIKSIISLFKISMLKKVGTFFEQ